MIIHKEKVNLTTSLSSASVNTRDIMGMCCNIVIHPFSNDTIYDFSITDENGYEIYERTEEVGELSELLMLPLRGIYTLMVSNASKDETFNILLSIQE